MSQPSSANPRANANQKPRWDIYTAMLLVALLAITTGVTFLGMELNRYEWKWRKKDIPPVTGASLDVPVGDWTVA
ncbi:MAG: hypothetical protein N2C14_03905 [Planctomycetales bacterium]